MVQKMIDEIPITMKTGKVICAILVVLSLTVTSVVAYTTATNRMSNIESLDNRQNEKLKMCVSLSGRINSLERSCLHQERAIDNVEKTVVKNQEQANDRYLDTNKKLSYMIGLLEELTDGGSSLSKRNGLR